MPSPIISFRLPVVMALICLTLVLLVLPASLDLWRKGMCGVLSVSLGYQIATALRTVGKAERLKSWLECASFPIVMAAMLHLPETNGWILLGLGVAWRFLVGGLFRRH